MLIFVSHPARGGESEFLLFYSADDVERRSVDVDDVARGDFTPSIDLLYSYSTGRWRILGEYFLTDDENELERLQVGWDFTQDDTLWFGRYHQPLSFWNFQFHHGAYLQPSISRPAIEAWEDDQGVIPMHVTGTMLETLSPVGDGQGLRFIASLGLGPRLEDNELVPFDVLDPDDSEFSPAASVSVSWYPDIIAESNVGVVVGYSELESAPNTELGAQGVKIEQVVAGLNVNWHFGDWQVLSAAYYVDNHSSSGIADGWFSAGYLQLGRAMTSSVSAYGRIEDSRNADKSDYLALFPEFIQSRALLGLRWDFADRQALSIEIGDSETTMDDFREYRLQWSGVIP